MFFCVLGENGIFFFYDFLRFFFYFNGIYISVNSLFVNGFFGNKEDDLDNCSDEEFSDMMD